MDDNAQQSGADNSDYKPTCKRKKTREVADDHGFRVYQVKCSRECLPLLHYHCHLTSDIATKYQKVKQFSSGQERPVAVPNIVQTKELLFTVVTDGTISEDLPLIVRKQNLNHTSYTDITEESSVSSTIHEAKGSFCCLVFEHSGVLSDVKAACILRVTSQTSKTALRRNGANVIESDMTEQDIRKSLTHFLADTLFSYAEKIVEILKKIFSATPPEKDSAGLIQQAKQAANALLNRKGSPVLSTSHQTTRIPDAVALKLNKLDKDGVLAFGLFSTGMVVFVDENVSGQRHRRLVERHVKIACDPIYKSPKVEYTSKPFLRPTCMKQGDKLKNQTTNMFGTLGMITHATVDRRAEMSGACGGSDMHGSTSGGTKPNQDNDRQLSAQKIVVALTSGHYFSEGDIAVSGNEQDFGTCIASLLSEKTDIAVIEVNGTARYSFNFYDEKDMLCNCVPLKRQMQIDDAVYKRGAITKLTKGYIHSPDFRVCNSENTVPLCREEDGYLVQGNADTLFAKKGDSGSVVFFPDLEDTETETVQIVSLQSSSFDNDTAKKMNIPPNVSHTFRADRCFEKLRDEKRIDIMLPNLQDMQPNLNVQ